MHRTKFLVGFLLITLFSSFVFGEVLIKDPARLADIQRMLKVQKELTSKSLIPIWDVLDRPLAQSEKQALEFLYAYMPLSDLADYKPEFFLKNAQLSLTALKEMPWGKNISEGDFLHFVLPLRVNNENLDDFRAVMYPEIKARVKGMSMKDAALEINHWCHEKVNYRGTDSRTSAPLSTVKKSFGRCGEESTFTVTALRTAGIPARQVYTPRWAHSDDNHAWVEVCIDGKWNYLGACEPDPDLNMGWFSEPASRAMLVHTRAYGHYFGSDPVIQADERFSELNLTANYAPVKKIVVRIKDVKGLKVDSAKVEYQLYNYAEYYPISTNYTAKNGLSTLITGMGDLVVWASKDGKFAFQKFSVPASDTLDLVLNQRVPNTKMVSYDFIPPHAAKIKVTVSEEASKENARRNGKENEIRSAYMHTFKDSAYIAHFAAQNNLPFDTLTRFFKLSYGNWSDLSRYLEKNASLKRQNLLEMIVQIADKDFSDTPEAILTDHLLQANKTNVRQAGLSKEIYTRYILSPRIDLEMLTPWRSFLYQSLGSLAITDASQLSTWIRQNITINTVSNKHSRAPLSPKGVYNLRVADPLSRDIFFVAACRTFNIPARLNPENRQPEYYKNGSWLRAGFENLVAVQPEKGFLTLINKSKDVTPQYALHFTIAYLKNGFYRSLDFPEGKALTESKDPIQLDIGNYALVTGNRQQDGSVLSNMTFFTIEKSKTTTVAIELRKQSGVLKPTGKLNLTQLNFQDLSTNKVSSLNDLVASKSSVIVLLNPEQEPSKHILNDLGPYASHLNKWGGEFIFAMAADKVSQAGVLKTYLLPNQKLVGVDQKGNILKALTDIYGEGLKDKMPLVVLADQSGNIFLFSSGYKIGIGEQILKVISGLPKAPVTKTSCTVK